MEQNKVQRIAWLLVAVLVIVLLLLISSRYSSDLLSADMGYETIPLCHNCDIANEHCDIQIPGKGLWTLNIKPKPVKALKDLKVTLTQQYIVSSAKPLNLDKISMNLEVVGVSMDMGINRFKLTLADDNTYKGNMRLPVCSTDMKWELRLQIDDGVEKLQMPFPFNTKQ